jgi:hypothetical protein
MSPTQKEIEELEFSLIKYYYRDMQWRIGNIFWCRKKHWQKIKEEAGSVEVSSLCSKMVASGFLEPTLHSYKATKRGLRAVKRNWLYTEKHWYDADIIRKWSFILSVTAFIVSIAGPDNIRSFITYLFNLAF